MAETLTSGVSRLEIDARRPGSDPRSTVVPAQITSPEGNPLPSKSSARLAALTVAAVCSAAAAAQIVVLPTPAHADTVRVHDIQGDTRISPYAGKQVTDVTGIVTGVRTYGSSRGFWIQDPAPDADPATSEGVFVFTSSTPKGVAVGDAVSVSGTVSEYVPGGTSSGNQSLTQITRPTVTASPTATPFGVEPVNTKTPSLVAGSASGSGSWIQKPREEP